MVTLALHVTLSYDQLLPSLELLRRQCILISLHEIALLDHLRVLPPDLLVEAHLAQHLLML